MPYTGGLRRSLVPYSGEAENWGHGYNPIHESYGSSPLRVEPVPLRRGEVIPPVESVPETLTDPELWGYTLEDSRMIGVEYDGRPAWNEQPEQYRGDADEHPSWSAPQAVNEAFRALRLGAHRFRQKEVDALPSETVTEGWRHKPKGRPADAKPSDPSQYEVTTSMRQRYKTRVNDSAVARGTDEPRASIDSRVIGEKLKVYSEGMRHYDMTPRRQTPILRGFSYRTAGVGPEYYMAPNAYQPVEAIQRTPPPDPSMGPQETTLIEDYGYTPEDQGVW